MNYRATKLNIFLEAFIICAFSGTVLWTLRVQDEDGDTVTIGYPDYDAESKTLVRIRQTSSANGNASAEIVLNTTLDRDYVC